jgi:hypothetical protein
VASRESTEDPFIGREIPIIACGSQRLPAPVRGDDATISGDGWTFKAAAGWVVREGARR